MTSGYDVNYVPTEVPSGMPSTQAAWNWSLLCTWIPVGKEVWLKSEEEEPECQGHLATAGHWIEEKSEVV